MPATRTAEKRPMQSAEYREQVAKTIIDLLAKGVAPWQRPWRPGFGSPFNPVTGQHSSDGGNGRYRGGNSIYLQAVAIGSGYDDPRWVTFNQATHMKAGTMTPLSESEIARNRALPFKHPDRVPTWQIRKGEHGTLIEKWGTWTPKAGKDGPVPIIGSEETPERAHLFFRPFFVFNAAQVDGMPPYEPLALTWTPDQRQVVVESILRESGAQITHSGDRAYYSPAGDHIVLPPRAAFQSPEAYYATALHELGHWTGHASRLNREGITSHAPFGGALYAKEELRVEIASMMLANETGIPNDTERHAAYVGSWIQSLRDDHNEIFRASKDAGTIAAYIMDFHYKLGIDIEAPRIEGIEEPALRSPAAPSLSL